MTDNEVITDPAIPAIGIEVLDSEVIDTGEGDDSISGTAAAGNGVNAGDSGGDGNGIYNSGSIYGGAGNDSISGSATGGNRANFSEVGGFFGGDGGDGTGIVNMRHIVLGDGDDSFSGSGRGGFSNGGNGGIGIGIDNSGRICGGVGDDSFSGRGDGGYSSYSGNGGNGIGIDNSGCIHLGYGNDSFSGIGRGSFSNSGNGGIGIGIDNSGRIRGGVGDDFFSGTGTGGAGGTGGSNGSGIGIANSGGILLGDDGNDTVSGSGTTVGIQGGTIEGGAGNDSFTARRINAYGMLEDSQGGAVEDVLILGGSGDDSFDVGYGNATVRGGDGNDTLFLPGSSSLYTIGSPGGDTTYSRDGLTLVVSDIETVIFAELPPPAINTAPSSQDPSSQDTLWGGAENDNLAGCDGNDFLIGTQVIGDGVLQASEVDTLTGGSDSDTFALGDTDNVYYADSGDNDYPLVTDFSNGDGDVIQLEGKADDYVFDPDFSLDGTTGTDLFLKGTAGASNELIGLLQGISGLNGDAFSFV